MKYNFTQRLKYFKNKEKITGRILSEKSGIPLRTVEKLLSGETDNPRLKTLVALMDAFDVTPDTFFGVAELPENEKKLLCDYRKLPKVQQCFLESMVVKLEELIPAAQPLKPVVKKIEIPYYLTAVSAGTGSFLDAQECDLREYPEKVVPEDTDFALSVTGDSMSPVYEAGDTVFVKNTYQVIPGDICIVVINGDSYIKQFRQTHFFSFNPNYAPIIPSEYDNVTIIGRVVGKI